VEINGLDLGEIDHANLRFARALQKKVYSKTVNLYNSFQIRPLAEKMMQSSARDTSVTRVEFDGDIATIILNRPEKRNAMNDALVDALDAFFSNPPEGVSAVILRGEGGHFCSGLDLAEHESRKPIPGVYHSRNWHRVSELIEFGGLPVISVLTGAVIGGGLEIATSTHVRIAEPSVRFQLPEGRRGIFVGGGATVRVGRILGADRMREMMLTGRSYGAEDGLALGLTHYAVAEGEGIPLALKLARRIADNAPFSNYLMINAISRIGDMSRSDGMFTESLAAAMSQSSAGAQEGLRAFLEKREPKFR
jgi:enoyl-CoA hydratase/carnithine racemase